MILLSGNSIQIPDLLLWHATAEICINMFSPHPAIHPQHLFCPQKKEGLKSFLKATSIAPTTVHTSKTIFD